MTLSRVPFGRKAPSGASLDVSHAHRPDPIPFDSDGKRRIFGEKTFETHGDLLRQLGRGIDDPDNILPTEDDHERALQQSLDGQKQRHQALEAELEARHGYALIWPYYIVADAVWQGPHGLWLMRVMKLLPGDDWNVLYFASDRRTSDLVGLPVHPGGTIAKIDENAATHIAQCHAKFDHLRNVTDPFASGGFSPDGTELMEMFLAKHAELRDDILDFANFYKAKLPDIMWNAMRTTA